MTKRDELPIIQENDMEIIIQPEDILTDKMGKILGGGEGEVGCRCNSGFLCDRYTDPGGPGGPGGGCG